MIVVIDTNVWVSGLQFAQKRGVPTRALEKAMSEDTLAICDEIEAEILRILIENFPGKRDMPRQHWPRFYRDPYE